MQNLNVDRNKAWPVCVCVCVRVKGKGDMTERKEYPAVRFQI